MRAALVTLLLLAAGTTSLFFTGEHNVLYAPSILALLAAALLALLTGRNVALPRDAPAWLLLALWLYITLSLTWSAVPFASLVTWLVFSALPLGFFALTMMANGEATLKILVGVFLCALTLLAGFAVLQVVLWPDIFGRRAHAPLIDPNNLAALLSLGLLPLLACALSRPPSLLLRRGASLACAILFAGLLATQSRGGFLCAAIAALPIFWLLRARLEKKQLACMIIAALFIVALLQIPPHLSLPARLAGLARPTTDPNVMARLSIWRGTWRLITRHPFAGTGFGTFYLYYPAVRTPLSDDSSGQWAHNDPLQFWAETGVAAPLLLYAFILSVTWRTARALRHMPRDSFAYMATAGLACGLLAVALQAHISFQFYILPTLITGGIWLAAWYRLTAAALPESFTAVRKLWSPPLLPLLALGIAAPVTLLTVASAAGQIYFQRAQDALAQGHVGPFLDNTGRAEKFAPGSFIDPEVALAGFYIDLIGKPSALFSAAEQKQMAGTAATLLDEAQAFNPAWSEIDRKRARLALCKAAAVPDSEAQAMRDLQTAVAKNPMNFRARQDLAVLLANSGRPGQAYSLLDGALGYPHPADIDRDYQALLRSLAPYAHLQEESRP